LEELLIKSLRAVAVLLFVTGVIAQFEDVLRHVVLVDDPVVDRVREPPDG